MPTPTPDDEMRGTSETAPSALAPTATPAPSALSGDIDMLQNNRKRRMDNDASAQIKKPRAADTEAASAAAAPAPVARVTVRRIVPTAVHVPVVAAEGAGHAVALTPLRIEKPVPKVQATKDLTSRRTSAFAPIAPELLASHLEEAVAAPRTEELPAVEAGARESSVRGGSFYIGNNENSNASHGSEKSYAPVSDDEVAALTQAMWETQISKIKAMNEREGGASAFSSLPALADATIAVAAPAPLLSEALSTVASVASVDEAEVDAVAPAPVASLSFFQEVLRHRGRTGNGLARRGYTPVPVGAPGSDDLSTGMPSEASVGSDNVDGRSVASSYSPPRPGSSSNSSF